MKTFGITIFLALIILTNLSGDEGFWKRHTIDPADKSTGKLGADGVRLADANGDGRMDVVTGWENGDAIRVCLNPGPDKARLEWPAVTVGHVSGAEDAVFVDLDGDGAMDVVSCCEGKTKSIFVHWASVEAARYLDSDAWQTREFPAAKRANRSWMYCLPFDVNHDGAIDLVVGSKSGNASVSWLMNPGRKDEARDLSKWKLTEICPTGWIMSIIETDLDGDKKTDIVFSNRKGPAAGIYWLKSKTVAPFFEKEILLGASGEEVMFLDIVDVNGDGHLDIGAAIRPDKIGFLIQPSGTPDSKKWEYQELTRFVPQDQFGGSKAIRVADMDLDGHLDVIFTCEHAKGKLSGCVMVTFSTGELGGKLLYTNIAGPEGVKFDRIELLDLDSDGDLDVMTCEERDNLGVFWYENPAR